MEFHGIGRAPRKATSLAAARGQPFREKVRGFMDHKVKDCDCIFCGMRCPKCGGVNIHVEFLARFSHTNEKPNSIYISHNETMAQVFCTDCGDVNPEEEYFYLDGITF
jgi:hypothetical protein